MIAWIALALALLNTMALLGFGLGVALALRKAAPYMQMFSALGQAQTPRRPGIHGFNNGTNEPLP